MLKVYKRTIEICVPISFFLFGFAYSFNLLQLHFLTNWLIGVGSSLIVVVITTYLQYKREKDNSLSEICSAVDKTLDQMFFILMKGYSDDCEKEYAEIERNLKIISKLSSDDLFLFSRKNDTRYEKLGKLAKRMLIMASSPDETEKKLVRVVCKKYYISLATKAIAISKYDFEKEYYTNRINILDSIEKIKGSLAVYGSEDEYYQSRFGFSLESIRASRKEILNR